MKLLGFNKVLCLSPHPDDVEYSMLGTILKYTDTQFYLLQLAQGGDCDETTGKERLVEVENVWKTANCNNLIIINTPHKYIKELTEERDFLMRGIEKMLLRINPTNQFYPLGL